MERPKVLKKGSPRTIAYMAYIRSKPRKEKTGKGLIKDLGKKAFNVGMNMVPMPGLVRDVGQAVGNVVIDKVGEKYGLGMKKKRGMKGGALRMAGY